MNTGIHIEGHAGSGNPESLQTLGEQIQNILSIGFECRAEQSTIQLALRILEHAAQSQPGIEGMTISNSTVTGDQQQPLWIVPEEDLEEIDD